MGLFGKSFEEQVKDAIDQVKSKHSGIKALEARIDGKNVTLTGEVQTPEVKAEVMHEFNTLVKTDNTMNQIRITAKPAPVAAPVPAPAPMAGVTSGAPAHGAPAATGERTYVVAKGDTLSAIAMAQYGKSSLYMKIFEANRDQLKDPDKIQIGQKLRIPALGSDKVS